VIRHAVTESSVTGSGSALPRPPASCSSPACWARDRATRRARVAVALAGLWLLSPIDLLPEFLP
jgi:hypothetical protein